MVAGSNPAGVANDPPEVLRARGDDVAVEAMREVLARVRDGRAAVGARVVLDVAGARVDLWITPRSS